MEPGTDRPKGAKGGAKITRESSKETLGKGRERVGMHIKKQEFTRKKNRHDHPLAKSPGPPGASYTVLPSYYTNGS